MPIKLCVVVGNGPVGRYVAEHIQKGIERYTADKCLEVDLQIIGLRSTRNWLKKLLPHVELVSVKRFDKCLAALKKRNATDVIFVGDPYGSFRFIDKLAALPSLIRGRPFLWAPHAYVHGLKIKLHEHKITLRDPLEFLPELAANAGLQVGAHCENYDAHRDLRGVTEYLEKKIESQRWREVCQTVIVDQGRVVMPRVELRTNRLIKKFGSSPERKSAVFPVLCKIVVPPFEKVDVPTIGLDTVRLCAENGIRAIVVQGGKTILMQPDDVRAFADRGSISVYAL